MNFNYDYYEDEEYIKKEEFISDLEKILYKEKCKKSYLDLVFLCIGTDRMTGDCFGPLVGTKIKEKIENNNIFNINIYGSLEENVSYTNIDETLNKIKKKHPNSYIIAIDAALSKKENIGKIFVNEGKLTLARGLNKNKIQVGNANIKAVVGKDYKLSNYNFIALQNISLNSVIKLADIVSEGIIDVIKYN